MAGISVKLKMAQLSISIGGFKCHHLFSAIERKDLGAYRNALMLCHSTNRRRKQPQKDLHPANGANLCNGHQKLYDFWIATSRGDSAGRYVNDPTLLPQ